MPAPELGQGPRALWLGLAAVQGRGTDTAAQQVSGQPVHRVLGVEEHDHPPVPRGDLGGRLVLVRTVHMEYVVLHGGDGTRRRVDGVDHRVRQIAADQQVDVAVEGGGEQHPLPAGTHLVEQGGDLGHEAHVGHLVGLVEDRGLDTVQPALAPVDEVLEPPGGGDDHLGAVPERGGLAADGHPADDGGQPQAHGAGVRGERVGDLLGELAGGDQDEGERLPGLGAPPRRAGQHGEAEGEGLARAGAATAEHVTAGQGVRQGGRLDRERHGHAFAAERGQQPRGHGEIGERPDGGQRGRDRPRRGELALHGPSGLPVPVAPGTARATGAAAAGASPEAVVGAGCAGTLHGEPSLVRRVARNSRSR